MVVSLIIHLLETATALDFSAVFFCTNKFGTESIKNRLTYIVLALFSGIALYKYYSTIKALFHKKRAFCNELFNFIFRVKSEGPGWQKISATIYKDTSASLDKLAGMTDAEFEALELYPDFTRTLSKNASPPCRSTAAYIFSFLSAFPVLYLAYRTEIWRDKDGKKKSNRTEILKEILTAAVAIIAAAVYFFSGAKPYFCQQYFRPWHRAV